LPEGNTEVDFLEHQAENISTKVGYFTCHMAMTPNKKPPGYIGFASADD
jgi:hypothetical protein